MMLLELLLVDPPQEVARPSRRCVWSIRMSSGPSFRNENPRSARSSCGDDTPRSTRKPSIGTIPSRSSTSRACENGAWTSVTRSPNG